MASASSSLEYVIKSEKFQCRRVPNQNVSNVIMSGSESNIVKTSQNTAPRADPQAYNKSDDNVRSGYPLSNGGGGLLPTPVSAAKPSVDIVSVNANRMKSYGRVVISLENPILPQETIENTPSMADGLDRETEHHLRITGCKLIQISGILLRLPQVAMATGQVLFQRYYYTKSFVRFPMEYTAMACVVLASKVEEAPRRIRDVINVFNNMKQIRLGEPTVPMLLNEYYVNLKNQVIKSERRILKELGFCVHVKHPHKYIITVAEILGHSKNTQLIQAAWSYMNDSLHTNVFVRFSPETIACACIHLSARVLKVPLPTSPPWYSVFGVDTQTITQVCTTILQLYTCQPLPQEQLEEKVENAKKILDNAKLKARSTQSATLEATNTNSTDSITVDSRTSSPIKYGEAPSNSNISSSKSLEILSVINRLKQQRSAGRRSGGDGSAKSSPKLSKNTEFNSNNNETDNQFEQHGNNSSNANSAANSVSSTPIKLEKSPRTLVLPLSQQHRQERPPQSDKRSRSPSSCSEMSDQTGRSNRSRSRSESDDEQQQQQHQRRRLRRMNETEMYQSSSSSSRRRENNDHSNYRHDDDAGDSDHQQHYDQDHARSSSSSSSKYNDRYTYHQRRERSRTPPRSFISSAVLAVNDCDAKSNRRRSPSPPAQYSNKSSNNNRCVEYDDRDRGYDNNRTRDRKYGNREYDGESANYDDCDRYASRSQPSSYDQRRDKSRIDESRKSNDYAKYKYDTRYDRNDYYRSGGGGGGGGSGHRSRPAEDYDDSNYYDRYERAGAANDDHDDHDDDNYRRNRSHRHHHRH